MPKQLYLKVCSFAAVPKILHFKDPYHYTHSEGSPDVNVIFRDYFEGSKNDNSINGWALKQCVVFVAVGIVGKFG